MKEKNNYLIEEGKETFTEVVTSELQRCVSNCQADREAKMVEHGAQIPSHLGLFNKSHLL